MIMILKLITGGRSCRYSRSGTYEPNPRRRDADYRCNRACRSGRGDCNCEELESIEDVERLADFFEKYGKEAEDLAYFLADAYAIGGYHDSYDEDSYDEEE